MNRFRHLIAATVTATVTASAVVSLASLTACSTVLPTAHSGFLSDYTALAGGPDAASASRAPADRIDPARVTVDAVAWRVTGSADISTDISTQDREALLALLRSELQQRVRALPAQPQGRPAVDRKSTRLNSSHSTLSRMPSSA